MAAVGVAVVLVAMGLKAAVVLVAAGVDNVLLLCDHNRDLQDKAGVVWQWYEQGALAAVVVAAWSA